MLSHFSTKGRGTSLGLATGTRIVAEYRGTIHIQDNSPAGSRFLITFPAADVPVALPS